MDGIQLNTRLSDQEMAKLNMQVDSFNKSITIEGRKVQRDLGKDDFLKLFADESAPCISLGLVNYHGESVHKVLI